MQQITKRWLSLLLAATLCVTAGGIPALAADEENTGSSSETADTGDSGNASESGVDNGITTLPTTGEERPVISVDVPGESGDGDTTVTEPENPETPSEDEPPAEETKPQEGGNSGTSTVIEQPEEKTEAIPEGFFQPIEVGKAYADGKMQDFTGDVDWNSQCAVLFHYTVPKDMTADTKYTFKVDAPLELGVGFTIYGEDDKAVATGYVGADGESWLKFTDADYAKKDVSGYFYVGTKFKKSAAGNGGKQTIEIKIDGTTVEWKHEVNFAAPVVEAGVKVSKDFYTRDYLKDHKIKWELKIEPWVKNADAINSLVVTDPIPDKMTYMNDTAQAVIKTRTGETAEGDFVYDSDKRELQFIGKGNSLQASSWPLYVTFFAEYSMDDLPTANGGVISFYNKANAEIQAPNYVKHEDDTVTLEPNQITASGSGENTAKITCLSMEKEGALVSGQRVHWKIKTINGMNLPNPKITDNLPVHMNLVDGSVKLTYGNTVKQLEEGTDYTLTQIDTQDHQWQMVVPLVQDYTDVQTLEYDTAFDSDGDSQKIVKIVNHAQADAGSQSVSRDATVHLGSVLMTKDGTYHPETHTIDWTIKLTADGMGFKHIKIRDELHQYINNQQVSHKLVPGTIKINGTAVENDKITVEKDGKSFIVEIADDHVKDGVLTYTTILEDGNQFWANNIEKNFPIKNNAYLEADGLGGTSLYDKTVYGTSTMLKKEFGSYNAQTHEITWKLTVNQNQMALTNAAIEDTLPTGWAFVENSIEPSNVTVTCDGQKMTLHLPDMQAGEGPLEITYKTKLVNNNLLKTNEQITVNNTATLKGDQIPAAGVSSSATAEIGSNVLEKSIVGKLDENLQLTWQVDVNSNLATITVPDGGQLGIEDVLQSGLSYVDGSMEVCNLNIDENGTRAAGNALTLGTDYTVAYNSKTRQLVVRWNTDTINSAYRLTFKTRVLVSGQYSNTVKFVGFDENSGLDAGTSIDWVSYSGGFSNLPKNMGGLRIIKTDSETGKLLAGVKFLLTDSTGTELGVFTTGANGIIDAIISEGQWEIEEIETLDGYVLPETFKWTVTVKNNETATLNVKNDKSTTETSFRPEVTKKITGENVPAGKTFEFEIAAVTANAPLPKNTTASVTDEGTAYFDPIAFAAAGEYKYTITERDGGASGFTYDTAKHTMTVTVEKENGALKVASVKYDGTDSLTITNTYEKPSEPSKPSGGGGGGGSTEPAPKPTPEPDKPVDPTDPEPDTPTTPTEPENPSEPTTPTTPTTPSNPSNPTPPTYPIDRVPDPNEPGAPDTIIVIDDDDVPLGEFHIEKEPDGTLIYVDDDDIPLGVRLEKIEDDNILTDGSQQPQTTASSVPQTGTPVSSSTLLKVLGILILLFGATSYNNN